MARKLKNALVHGVYSSDLILPWEKAEDFIELLNGLRRDFQPIGMSEDLAIFDKACAYWKKFRMQRVNQVALHQNAIAAQIEESGKRGVNGIRSHLDRVRSKKKRRHEELATAASELAEAADLLAQAAKSNSGLGKVGANMRYVVGLLEKVQPIIAEAGKADKNDGGEFADFALFL